MDVGYKEKENHLSVRIEVHKKYSNFSLENWFNENLPFKPGETILDIGCGNGNFFPTYSKKLGESGCIIGCDKLSDLLNKAAEQRANTPTVLLEWDINKVFPFIERSFNYIISTFAIYYVDDVAAIMKTMERLLKYSGEVILIGPTDKNAKELYDFNKKVFDVDRDPKITKRTNRLEYEFYPVMADIFKNTTLEHIPSKIIFPDKKEFLRYYLATLLYEESLEKTGLNPTTEDIESMVTESCEISKEMIVLRGQKNV